MQMRGQHRSGVLTALLVAIAVALTAVGLAAVSPNPVSAQDVLPCGDPELCGEADSCSASGGNCSCSVSGQGPCSCSCSQLCIPDTQPPYGCIGYYWQCFCGCSSGPFQSCP